MKAQLFLLHFAGGSCYSFDFLKKSIHSDIEFIPLELPGRGKRLQEKLIISKEDAINDYLKQIKVLRNDKPFLVFGHSMGATLGLSIVNKLEANGDSPEMLIVSGNAGPGIVEEKIKRYLLKDEEFKQMLIKLGGIPNEVLESEELYNFFSPILRADFEVLEKDTFLEEKIKIATPIFALMGSEEKTVNKIENWGNFTTGSLKCKILEGNHFFIYNYIEEIAALINNSKVTLKEYLAINKNA